MADYLIRFSFVVVMMRTDQVNARYLLILMAECEWVSIYYFLTLLLFSFFLGLRETEVGTDYSCKWRIGNEFINLFCYGDFLIG